MSGSRKSCCPARSLSVGLSLALAASLVSQAFALGVIRPHTVPRPPTTSQILATIHSSPALNRAVQSSLKVVGGAPKRRAPLTLPSRHGQSPIAARAGFAPCDFDQGVSMDILHSIAADNLPPTEWASLEMEGVQTIDPSWEGNTRPWSPPNWPEAALKEMTFRNGEVYARGIDPPVTVTVKFHPTVMGVYAVTFTAPTFPGYHITAAIANDSIPHSSPATILGTTASGGHITTLVKVDNMPAAEVEWYCNVTYTVPVKPQPGVAPACLGGVQILHVTR